MVVNVPLITRSPLISTLLLNETSLSNSTLPVNIAPVKSALLSTISCKSMNEASKFPLIADVGIEDSGYCA